MAEPLSHSTYAALRRQILDGVLASGAMALEGELAASLGVSRTPVRQALVRLADEGLIELRPRHGMRVRPIAAADMAEIYEMLAALEGAAARRCAECGLERKVLDALDGAVAAMDAALAADDLPGWAGADARFHRLLVEASGNRRLAASVAGFSDQVQRARIATLALRPKPTGSNADHRAVVEAIRAGDAGRAETLHRQHRARVGALLVQLLAGLPAGA